MNFDYWEELTDTYMQMYFDNYEPLAQKKGVHADYIIDNEVYEVKIDRAAIKTGNLFIEIAQSSNTQERKPSGLMKTLEKGYNVIIFIPYENDIKCYVFTAQDMLNLIQDLPEKKTKPFVNGNAGGFFSYGKLLKVKEIEKYAKRRN
jgi:hypothetical protein